MAANECILMAILPKLPLCIRRPQRWMGARRRVAGGGRACPGTSMSMVGLELRWKRGRGGAGGFSGRGFGWNSGNWKCWDVWRRNASCCGPSRDPIRGGVVPKGWGWDECCPSECARRPWMAISRCCEWVRGWLGWRSNKPQQLRRSTSLHSIFDLRDDTVLHTEQPNTAAPCLAQESPAWGLLGAGHLGKLPAPCDPHGVHFTPSIH